MQGRVCSVLLLLCWLLAPEARAQFAVVDVGAIAQLVQQVRTLQAELEMARNQLAQAQVEYASITGNRGMERLLSGVQRNYLPGSWWDVQTVLQSGGGTYAALAAGVRDTAGANSMLSPQQVALLSPVVQQLIDMRRRLTALSQNVARQSLATTSNRFASLQLLVEALGGSADQKAVLDLQARIGAENAMLQNERTKLQTLNQLVQSEQEANRQQQRELALAGHGQFATRFQPAP
jgi:type IV secretion system protein VirB5